MNARVRKLIGGAGMIGFVLVYALVAMALADSRPMSQAPEMVRTLIFVVLGLAWVLPLMPLIVWMERGSVFKRR
jgi:predicted membrane channel-forming protein YqfA (hemolysin III family)